MNDSGLKPTIKPIVVLVSGRGSNLQALLTRANVERWDTTLGAKIAAVVSNRADAEALDVARAHQVPVHILGHEEFGSRAAFDEALARTLERYAPELIVLAGFMRRFDSRVRAPLRGPIDQLHPSLLPSFPGLNTHQRALDDRSARAWRHGTFVSEEVDAARSSRKRRWQCTRTTIR